VHASLSPHRSKVVHAGAGDTQRIKVVGDRLHFIAQNNPVDQAHFDGIRGYCRILNKVVANDYEGFEYS